MDIIKKSKKQIKPVIDSRHLKILSVKTAMLRDSLVFIWLDEQKFGLLDQAGLRHLAQKVEKFAPDSCYFPLTKKHSIDIIDRAEFKDKELLIQIETPQPLSESDVNRLKLQYEQAIPGAKDIKVVCVPKGMRAVIRGGP